MLPIYTSSDQTISLLQTNWSQQLNPILGSPLATPTLLSNVVLTLGSNTVNHMLDQNLQGWIVVRQRGNASIWDNQDNNKLPNKTLILMSTSGVNIDLLVF